MGVCVQKQPQTSDISDSMGEKQASTLFLPHLIPWGTQGSPFECFECTLKVEGLPTSREGRTCVQLSQTTSLTVSEEMK